MNEILKSLSETTGVKYSDEQLRVLEHEGGMNIVACAGSGKALVNGTGVMTPYGYKKIEELKVGDDVIDDKGQSQKVLGVYPQGEKVVYRVTLNNGNYIDCCKDHLWTVGTGDKKRSTDGKWLSYVETISTLDIKKRYSYGEDPFDLPHVGPVQFADGKKSGDFKIAPYTFGHMLVTDFRGAGIRAEYKDEYERLMLEAKESNGLYEIETDSDVVKTTPQFEQEMRRLHIGAYYDMNGVIPSEYLHASVNARISLLQGIIDSCGCIYTKDNMYDYVIYNAGELFAKSLETLCEELGLFVRLEESERRYNVRLNGTSYIKRLHYSKGFALKYSNDEQVVFPTNWRYIVSVKRLKERREMTCIEISGDSKLYLTEHCIPTHNTTTLCHLLVKRIISGEIEDTSKLLVTTYSIAGKDELQIRVNNLLNKMGVLQRVEIRTLHSAYYKILKKLGRLGNIGTAADGLRAIGAALKENKVRLDEDDTATLVNLLSYQINNMMTDEMLYNNYVFTLDMDLKTYSAIRKSFAQKKVEMGFMDFDDLQLQIYVLLKNNPQIREYVSHMWDYFYIDEFQDVSKIQYEIMKMMLRDPKKLVVIGDDDQCIYSWRGADPNIILNICGTYDIERFILSTNYRCGGEIVKRANIGIKNNNNRFEKEMRPFNEGGKINAVYSYDEDYYELSKKTFNKIKELILDGAKQSDISVLCRNNAHGVILNQMLLSEGIIHRFKKDVSFHNNKVIKDLKVCVELASNTYNFNIVTPNLWKLVCKLSVKNCSIIAQIMKDCGCTFLQAVKTFLIESGNCYEEGIENDSVRPVNINNREVRGTFICNDAVISLKDLYKTIRDKEPADAAIEIIKRYRMLNVGFLYKSDDSVKQVEGDCKYFIELLKSGINVYNETMEKTKNLSEFEIEPTRDCINLSTMHGAKGKEWKHVILMGIDGNSCPARDRISTLLDTKDGMISVKDLVEQERRLFYVAFTRAKEELTIITDLKNMSPFMLETFGLIRKKDYNEGNITEWVRTGKFNQKSIDEYIKKLSEIIEIEGMPSADCNTDDTGYISDSSEVFNENFSSGSVSNTGDKDNTEE